MTILDHAPSRVNAREAADLYLDAIRCHLRAAGNPTIDQFLKIDLGSLVISAYRVFVAACSGDDDLDGLWADTHSKAREMEAEQGERIRTALKGVKIAEPCDPDWDDEAMAAFIRAREAEHTCDCLVCASAEFL